MTIVKTQTVAVYLAVLVCAIFSILVTSCGKEDPEPENDADAEEILITSFKSIHYDQVKVDTLIEKLDDYLEVFETPVTELDLGDLYAEVMDSVHIDLDLADNTRPMEGLLLPEIKISEPYVSLTTAGDSLMVDNFPLGVGFVPIQRGSVSEKLEGKISRLEIFRKYERIVYTADVVIVARTSNEATVQLEGKFQGSKLGRRMTDVIVH